MSQTKKNISTWGGFFSRKLWAPPRQADAISARNSWDFPTEAAEGSMDHGKLGAPPARIGWDFQKRLDIQTPKLSMTGPQKHT